MSDTDQTATSSPPPLARTVLFGPDSAAATAGLAVALDSSQGPDPGWLHSLSPSAGRVATGEIAALLTGLLEIDLVEVLASGWLKIDEIREAAGHTLTDPGATEVVELAQHAFSYEQHPRVDIVLDDVRLASVDVTLSLALTVSAAVLTINEGRLKSIRPISCEAAASLSIENHPVLSRSQEIRLPVVISINHLIPLPRRPAG